MPVSKGQVRPEDPPLPGTQEMFMGWAADWNSCGSKGAAFEESPVTQWALGLL